MPTRRSSLPLFLLVTVAACHARPAALPAASEARTFRPTATAQPPAPPAPPASAPRVAPKTPLGEAPLSAADAFNRKSLDDLNRERPLSDAFFAYNSVELSDTARRTLQADASWLAQWPGTRIAIEGHCDERGTAEYNFALGERRAMALRRYLIDLGVPPARVTTMSLGKEAPFCTRTETEACWSLNRRGHFVITAK